ncbi:MAG TPA: family 20 glycosylhydrolase [Chitinophagaceae bacterium]|nr:family 20 glycosylhydrolase [Chitinophagaceae bacterium]
MPQMYKKGQGSFGLSQFKIIVADSGTLLIEIQQLQKWMLSKGIQTKVLKKAVKNQSYIEISLRKPSLSGKSIEAYKLDITSSVISLSASTAHGIFNGIQTLKQLLTDGNSVNACAITDWPAFSWRGYMIDVGRNYMEMDLLKQQIDVMAAYKLNVFHFHATEDIAWRIAIKQYPQLTSPAFMMRNKGKYYSEEEIKELIAYCKERHITFVPELDMPGHSAAFKRAMGVDMQSDSGIVILKNILKEFCTTYDVPYIHIGADEVKITNKNFVPEITKYIESFGKKVIGWQPGGNFTSSTIRQLWMDDNAHISNQQSLQFIDSRHLYLNHMDPLEAVTSIFNRRIADKEKGDSSTLGGTICMWHDRAVNKDEDILKMNPVYPAMLAFAERSWCGGGLEGWISNISDGNVLAFEAFENRLLKHKELYFNAMPFSYVRQSGTEWNLYGPFDNNGTTDSIFPPETKKWNEQKATPYKKVIGGTIILRHWWAPLIKGAVDEPKENSTFYATTKIWTDKAGEKSFWIGFNNISRSPATDSPPPDAWDNKNSEVWVNGKLIDPPKWKHAGMKGNSEWPLVDEGYEYRQPTKIYLNKGWNHVLIKAPVSSFKGKDWQNPAKWMFTFTSL